MLSFEGSQQSRAVDEHEIALLMRGREGIGNGYRELLKLRRTELAQIASQRRLRAADKEVLEDGLRAEAPRPAFPPAPLTRMRGRTGLTARVRATPEDRRYWLTFM
jgi:hypothetical protein